MAEKLIPFSLDLSLEDIKDPDDNCSDCGCEIQKELLPLKVDVGFAVISGTSIPGYRCVECDSRSFPRSVAVALIRKSAEIAICNLKTLKSDELEAAK